MKNIILSQYKLDNLDEYFLKCEIDNNESKLYIYNSELLKMFKSTDSDIIDNKIFLLNELFKLKSSVNISEIVWPNKLIKCNSNVGYTMDYISCNTNLCTIFNSKDILEESKVYFLKLIYNILVKIEDNSILRESNFYLGDIHEGNFIYDNKNNSLKVIDIDSSYITGSKAFNSKFLTFNDKLWDFNKKYPLNDDYRHIPNKNTTILSYIYMLLNNISNSYVPDLSIKEFCDILNKMNYIGFNKELLDCIYNIYKTDDNYINGDIVDMYQDKLVLKYKEKYVKK